MPKRIRHELLTAYSVSRQNCTASTPSMSTGASHRQLVSSSWLGPLQLQAKCRSLIPT